MRFVRLATGLLLALVGLLISTAAAVVTCWVGPDDTMETGNQQLASRGLAVVTAPDLFDRHGPTLHISAHSSDSRRPLFVGVGNDLDVSSYLGNAAHTTVTRLSLPLHLEKAEAKGVSTALPAPAGIDWWTVKASGSGRQSITWPIADGRYDVVVMNADGTPSPSATVRLGVQLDGAFATGLLALGIGIVALVTGILLIVLRRTSSENERGRPSPAEISPRRQHSGVVRRVAAISFIGSLILVASGCVAVPQKNTDPPYHRPAVTSAVGRAVVARYCELNNKANASRDEKLTATIEGGDLLRMSRAGLTISRATDASYKNKQPPFSYPNPEIGAPEFSAYPMRFVAKSGVSTDKTENHLGVWERQTAASPWLATYTAFVPKGTPLPSLDGLRTPTQADLSRLATSPKAVARNVATYFTGGPQSPSASGFVVSSTVATMLTNRSKDKQKDSRASYLTSVSDDFTAGEPLTFITKSGDALLFLALSERYLMTVAPNRHALWSSGPVLAFTNHVRYSGALIEDSVHELTITIPAKGKAKVRILSDDAQLVGGGGY